MRPTGRKNAPAGPAIAFGFVCSRPMSDGNGRIHRVLMHFDLAQRRLKDVLEMPHQDAVRMIRSIKESSWRVSGKLANEYPVRAVEAVQSAFEDREPVPIIE